MSETKRPTEYKNEFGEDIKWGKGVNGNYTVEIDGPIEGAQHKRVHRCSGTIETEEEDNVKWKGDGKAKYVLKVEGPIEGARIVRMHKC